VYAPAPEFTPWMSWFMIQIIFRSELDRVLTIWPVTGSYFFDKKAFMSLCRSFTLF
jgi:hypothetical protein